MTQREYERLRRHGRPVSQGNRDSSDPEDGYLAFFKLRCLICFVLFLGLVAVDRRIDAGENPAVKQVVKYLNEETVPVSAILPAQD